MMTSRRCPEEPQKRYEESICSVMERLGYLLCDQLPDERDFCVKLVKDIVELKISGEEASRMLEQRVGRERFEEARRKVLELLKIGEKQIS